jgi:hypothetical protein
LGGGGGGGAPVVLRSDTRRDKDARRSHDHDTMLNDNAMKKNGMAEMRSERRALTTKAADKSENQADRYNTAARTADAQKTEAERSRSATELAAHERGTARGLLENQQLIG